MDEWRFVRFGDLGGWTRGVGSKHVVLLHGGPGLSDYLADLGDLLVEALGEQWTVVRYQQRGLEPSALGGQFTVEEAIADLETVCDALSPGPVTLVGHSWGGHLALHAAVAAPDRYRSLVIVDPLGAVGDGGYGAMEAHFAASVTPDEAARRAELAEQATVDGPSADLDAEDLAIIWPYYFGDPTAAPPMPPLRIGLDAARGLAESIIGHFINETLVGGLPSVSTPTLFLAGTRSPIPHTASERTAALMPNAEVVTAPTGHFPWIEAEPATIPLVSTFIAPHET